MASITSIKLTDSEHQSGKCTDEWSFYEKLRHVRTVKDARALGRSIAGLHKDLLRGRLKLQGPDGKLIRETYPSAKRKFKGKFVLRVRQTQG